MGGGSLGFERARATGARGVLEAVAQARTGLLSPLFCARFVAGLFGGLVWRALGLAAFPFVIFASHWISGGMRGHSGGVSGECVRRMYGLSPCRDLLRYVRFRQLDTGDIVLPEM
jgi:hypothetical protein